MASTACAGAAAGSALWNPTCQTKSELRLEASYAACPIHISSSLRRQEIVHACLKRQQQIVQLRRPTSFSVPNVRRRQGSQIRAEAVGTVDKIREVGNETFHAVLEEAGDKLVVLDMYTQW